MKRLSPTIGAMAGLFAAWPLMAGSFVPVGIHPDSASQPTGTGRTLAALAGFNGKVYAGFGDYNANSGPIGIRSFDPVTGSFSARLLNAPTEAVYLYREIGGKLYAPDIDPVAGEAQGGYSVGTASGGTESWQHQMPVDVIHMYDVAAYGDSLWMAGAQGNNATVWRSTDNGTNWSVSLSVPPSGSYSYVRIYGMAAYSNRLYVSVDAETNNCRFFDGVGWSIGPDVTPGNGGLMSNPNPFAGALVYQSGECGLGSSRLCRFDGVSSAYVGTNTNPFYDYKVVGSRLYGLVGDYVVGGGGSMGMVLTGMLVRCTDDLTNWQPVASAPMGARSLALVNKTLYLGATNAQLWRYDEPVDAGANVSVLTPDPEASEQGPDSGAFTIRRYGDTDQSLTVYFTISGSASNGVDYVLIPGNSVTFPPGSNAWTVTVTPFPDAVSESMETVVLGLVPDAQYGIYPPATGIVSIVDLSTWPTNLWVRNGGSASAATNANWSLGHAPTNGEKVLLGSYSPTPDMTWDLSNVVAGGWAQEAGYTGTVTFGTTFEGRGFPACEIGGTASLQGGTWTHAPNPAGNAEVNRLSVRVRGDFLLASNAAINADGKGFAAGSYGPGKGGAESYAGWGASHGGWDAERLSPGPYGSLVSPTNLGSSCASRAGGGGVLLEIAGAGTIDGTISAVGVNVTGSSGYNGGAGGSIWIKSGTLSGNGLLSARGGNAFYGGSAGGGRIAMLATNGFSFGQIRANAGGGINGPGNFVAYEGSAGTLYQEHAGHQPGKGILTLAESNSAYRYTMANWPVTEMPTATASRAAVNLDDFSLIVLTNGGTLGITPGTLMTNWSPGRLRVYGPENSFISVRGTNGLVFPSQMTISNYSLHLDVPVRALGNWAVASDGNLSHSFNSSLDLTLDGNLTVHTGGLVSAHRRGYRAGGPGGSGATSEAGPSHGGRGKGYGGVFKRTYGSVLGPTNWGSQNNDRGGGAIKLDVSGTVKVDGSVDADGDLTFAASGNYGSGSGGSIWMRAGSFAGTGGVHAAGGNGRVGPGGGGRISLEETAGSGVMALSCETRGGYSDSATYAAPGTIYRQAAGRAAGTGKVTIYAPATWTPGSDTAGTNTYCELPAATNSVPDELRNSTLELVQRGRVGLSTNLTVGNLYLVNGTGTMPQLVLNGFTLKVLSFYHEDWGRTNWVRYDGGRIVWKPSGAVLWIR